MPFDSRRRKGPVACDPYSPVPVAVDEVLVPQVGQAHRGLFGQVVIGCAGGVGTVGLLVFAVVLGSAALAAMPFVLAGVRKVEGGAPGPDRSVGIR